MEFTNFNAYCCVAPAYLKELGNDCFVLLKGKLGSDQIIDADRGGGIYLSAGQHVQVLSLGGEPLADGRPCNQFWEIDLGRTVRHKDYYDQDQDGNCRIIEGIKTGWVPKGHLTFFNEKVKWQFEHPDEVEE